MGDNLKNEKLKLVYEVAQPSQYRRRVPSSTSGNASTKSGSVGLRGWARYLEENDGTSIGILDSLVNNVIGTGIDVEPTPLNAKGGLHKKAHEELSDLWVEFRESTDITGRYPGGEFERLLCRSWLRDGEVFALDKYGKNKVNRFNFAISGVESDLVPFDLEQETPLIQQGVEVDSNGFVDAFHFLKSHPGDLYPHLMVSNDTTRVSSAMVSHLCLSNRLSQVRGVSVFHGVISRLEDIKNTEEFERVAMQIAAAYTAAITKSPEMIDHTDALSLSAAGNRELEMAAGVIFDDLLPGEDIKGIGLDRPNTKLIEFIDQQLRPVAAGTGVSFSTAARKYDGTYSAQRQELVETRPNFLRLTDYFISKFTRRLYRNFINFIIDTGQYVAPRGVKPGTIARAMFHGPGMIWIDPLKEAKADTERINNKTTSRHERIRQRGGSPAEVDRQIDSDPYKIEPEQEQAAPNEKV